MTKVTNKGKNALRAKMNQDNLMEEKANQEAAEVKMQKMQIEAQARDSARQSRNLGISYSLALQKTLIENGMVTVNDEDQLREMIIDRSEFLQNYILRGVEKDEPKEAPAIEATK